MQCFSGESPQLQSPPVGSAITLQIFSEIGNPLVMNLFEKKNLVMSAVVWNVYTIPQLQSKFQLKTNNVLLFTHVFHTSLKDLNKYACFY